MPDSLFARVTRYPRSPVIDPRENRLTEVTAAVLERVDGLAHRVVTAALATAVTAAEDQARLAAEVEPDPASGWEAEVLRLRSALAALQALVQPRVNVRTQATTLKGRFVDLEVWLRPRRPADIADDLRVWYEVKHGSDIHGDQLDVYLEDIQGYSAAHKVVLLLVPRGQELTSAPPMQVARVDWQAASTVVAEMLRPATGLPADQALLLAEYADYLREEGLMAPDALTATHALVLMGADDAELAVAGICEHAEAWVRANWGKPSSWKQPRGASTAHDYGSEYWAAYHPHLPGGQRAKTWPGAWFDWGFGWTAGWESFDDDVIRGSVAIWAGAGLEAKGNPIKVEGNEAWLAGRLAEGFHTCWFAGYNRLVRIKHPDELLVATTIEEQGQTLGRWVVEAFKALAANEPPN